MRALPTFALTLVFVFFSLTISSKANNPALVGPVISICDFEENDLIDVFQIYSVSQRGSNLLLNFKGTYKVRVHTGNTYTPYQELTTFNGYNLSVLKGQWCEIKLNGVWSFMTDADNR
ncbi:hypothetical protein GTQ34_09285 [Muricauda sp. JGD-17]|uniref:Uncharacterized protein n=1 Tax=Flagellimonas ochracea TaxID=2696472 RepID=A0A964TC18_9FLAO|nr:hypothetical protein [Allomuricauda ochracea]NAY92112.1 hypothetical protein [Allomuricauda ochracea]